MIDGEARGRSSRLYPLAYIASLTLVGLSSIALAVLGHEHVVDAAVQVAVGDDQAVVRQFVESNLTPADLDGAMVASERQPVIETLLADLVRRQGYRDITLVSARSGAVLAATADGSRASASIDAGTTGA